MGNLRVKTNKVREIVASVLSVAVLAFSAFNNMAVFAATSPAKQATPSATSQQLKVIPVKSDLSIAAGQSDTVPIEVVNLASSAVAVQAIENDFVAGSETGEPALILDPNSYAPSHSLKRFMVPISNLTIPANGSVEVPVHITVPKTAQAGGYFGAVRFTPAVGNVSSSGASLGASVASLILLTVPGPTVEQLTLTDFSAQQNGSTASNFRNGKQLSLFLRFQNKGNLQEAPFGQINVQKGKKVIDTVNFNQDDPKSEILPDSARRWVIPLKGFGKFGKYTVSGTFTYGTKGQTIDISKTVWIVPTPYIVAAIIAIVLILLLCGGSYVFLKSYKRKILKSSRRRY